MTSLQALWLGSWKASWSLGRGRRWGDSAWALAAIAQAWLLGGHGGRWPAGTWEARWPDGPGPILLTGEWGPRPPADWISLLRHGSALVPPDHRNPKESDLACACWEALRRGDGEPWMRLGTVLLDRRTRERWIPLLGAVDATGSLLLPPFLEPLVPPSMRRLPDGWWPFLLGSMDPEGRLLPEGVPQDDLPRALLERRDVLEPLILAEPPTCLPPLSRQRCCVRLDECAWMLDPRIRAWGRGFGICPQGLAPLLPPSPALGDPVAEPRGRVAPAHLSADPFHWLEEGDRALQAQDAPEALAAFPWAHAHFARLKDRSGARKAASGALRAALLHGDLPCAERWRRARGSLEPPWKVLEEAKFHAARGEWDRAAALARPLAAKHPSLAEAHALVARHDLLTSERKAVSAEAAGPGSELLLAFRRTMDGQEDPGRFWTLWEAHPHVPLRLETALRLLEHDPSQRMPRRLVALGTLAERTAAPSFQERLRRLWPQAEAKAEPDPIPVLEHWLANRPRPAWLLWGSPSRPGALGRGPAPPRAAAALLRSQGAIPPMEVDGTLWWGHALHWEGLPVGFILASYRREDVLRTEADAVLAAPWLARLAIPSAPPVDAETGDLLSDGSEPMASLLRELARVAPSKLPVLVLGPTGAGKELAAREIHARSGRKGPFIPINCSEYVETLMESELFGHAKGAFTGADRDRKGAVELAEGGTLFLDEVADLSPRLQSLFLRILQEKEVRRVGSDRIHKVDVRFLAATHRSLDQLVAEGRFRRDLHYRLKGAVLTLPSLAERRHEFPYLVPRLAFRVAREAGLASPDLAPGLADALARHPWPGNFRELRHAIERALLRRDGPTLKAVHFPELEMPGPSEHTWTEATHTFQRELLLKTLKQHQFRMTEAAASLDLTRPALYIIAKRLGVNIAAEKARSQTSDLST